MTDLIPADLESDTLSPQSPGAVFWIQLKKSPLAIAGGVILGIFYFLALVAPFAAPYTQEEMDRQRYFHPPQRLHWIHGDGHVSLRPFVRETRLVDRETFRYEEDPALEMPVRFFVRGYDYALLGLIPSNRHLYGVDPPGRIVLCGTDSFGRDVLSRLLYGGQISLTVGVVGILISFTLGLLLGGVAGYFGGIADTVIMRVTELLLSIPSLYLIIALRAVLPIDLPSRQVYLGIVGILAFIGWAGLARVIRGLVLAMRKSDFVAAAEALGFGRLRIIANHVLPNTMSYVIVAATLSIPGYILGEVVLSFLGVGVQEPSASWGNMLNQARSIRALTSFPWLLVVPGAAIFLTVMAFNFLGDGLRDALDPRRVSGGKAGVSEPLLRVENLKTYFYTDTAVIRAVDGVSFEVNPGETLAVVGESGSGKSVTALSILRLVAQPPGRIVDGRILFRGRDLLTLSNHEMRSVRGGEISMIFQEPMTALNPVYSVGEQIIETLVLHERLSRKAARVRAIEMLERVGIPAAAQRIDEYPHQLSGGMRQRVMIAMALACHPSVIIADEPTTALDVTIQAQILELLKALQREMGMAVILITHDLGVVAETADRVAVMYAGQVVEYCSVHETFRQPLHPYTAGLQASLPKLGVIQDRLRVIPGTVPNPARFPRDAGSTRGAP